MEDTQAIEAIQRSFTDKIMCPPNIQNYWERLAFLKLMSLQRRRERYCILHMWKVLHEKVSNNLNITFYNTVRFGTMASVPPLQRTRNYKAKTLYEMSFAVKGPQLWNLLPKHIKEIDSLNNFKANLDKFLCRVPDRPPVAGYMTQNNNSLLEWNNNRLQL